MDFSDVLGVLNDLPNTFTRPGPPYTQFIDATGFALSRFTEDGDAIEAQVTNFSTGPIDGWLDTWGLLMGVPRYADEANGLYTQRIARTVLAWVGTVPGVTNWISFFTQSGSVVENSPGVGYSITLPATMTQTQITQFLSSFNRIRPAGVPFVVYQIGIGTYLGTVDFTADGAVAGDYLALGTQRIGLNLNPMTLSNSPLLPMLLAVDPILNPGS